MSSGPVTSSNWHRVARLRPRLRSQAKLYRHRYRGELWYLLQDPATGRVHRFTPADRRTNKILKGGESRPFSCPISFPSVYSV